MNDNDQPQYLVIKTWKDLRTGTPRQMAPTVVGTGTFAEARERQIEQEKIFLAVFPQDAESVEWVGNVLTTRSFDVALYSLVE
jgi:hypothetical protein